MTKAGWRSIARATAAATALILASLFNLLYLLTADVWLEVGVPAYWWPMFLLAYLPALEMVVRGGRSPEESPDPPQAQPMEHLHLRHDRPLPRMDLALRTHWRLLAAVYVAQTELVDFFCFTLLCVLLGLGLWYVLTHPLALAAYSASWPTSPTRPSKTSPAH